MAKAKISKEFKLELAAFKKRFDAVARRHMCVRCGAREVNHRIVVRASLPLAVLPITYWICHECGIAHGKFMSEIRDAERERDRPMREAEQAERKRQVEARLVESRARANAERAASGLPPLPESGAMKPSGRGKKAVAMPAESA